MKLVVPFVLALCIALPAHAQDDPPAGEGLFSFMERMLRDFMTEAEPQLREFERGLTRIEPELNQFLDRMRDMTRYHPPEVLPNGDILIRRRQPEHDAPGDDIPPDAEDAPSDPFEL
jgi:hypothetical protein